MTFSAPLLMRKSIQGGKVGLRSSVETELLQQHVSIQYDIAKMLMPVKDLPRLQLENDRSDLIDFGYHPAGSLFWIDTSEQFRLTQIVDCNMQTFG
jgi:hypothetical protein